MRAIRQLLALRHLVVLICAVTLLLKIVVPTGYMIANDHGRLSITICPGVAPAGLTMAMSGSHGDMPEHGKSTGHGKAEMPCAFSSLSAAVTGAENGVWVRDPIAFVVAIGGLVLLVPLPGGLRFLRPPLRGPPALP